MFCQKPFTALQISAYAADSRILSGGHVASPVMANGLIQDRGWLARAAGVEGFADAGQYSYGQSYGGTP